MTTLIPINQYNTDKQSFEVLPDVSDLVTTTVLKRKIAEVENKISDFIG